MLKQIEQRINEVGVLQTKLVLLIGRPGSGKSALVSALAKQHGIRVMNVGAALGRQLAAMSQRQRALQANVVLRDLADEHAEGDLLLLDNLELLFDRSLKLDPLDLLKRHAHARRVVAVWPGVLREGRLVYAEMGHPEYQDYGLDGLVPFEIESLG